MSQQDPVKQEFLIPDLKKDGAKEYLQKIRSVAEKHAGKHIVLEKVDKYQFKVGPFNNTSYKDIPDLLEEWEQFYLPDHMRMEVIGVLEKFPCNADSAELVLMVCENGMVFAFEEERLHLVANDLKELFKVGVQFPGFKHYYRGQSFEDMTEEDCNKVNKSDEIIKNNKEHQEMLKSMKKSYLENLEAVMHRQEEKQPTSEMERGKPPIPVP